MAVHDVEVKPGEAELADDGSAGPEIGVITGENGGGEERRVHEEGLKQILRTHQRKQLFRDRPAGTMISMFPVPGDALGFRCLRRHSICLVPRGIKTGHFLHDAIAGYQTSSVAWVTFCASDEASSGSA